MGSPWGGFGARFYSPSPAQHKGGGISGALDQSSAEQKTLGVVPAALVAVNNAGACISCGNFPALREGWLRKQAPWLPFLIFSQGVEPFLFLLFFCTILWLPEGS